MKTKNPYLKYKNSDSRCWYPFEPDALGYCWGYAQYVDMKATKKEIIKLCKKCEYWHDKNDDDGGDFLRDQHEDWVASGRKEEAELEAYPDDFYNAFDID